MELLRWLHIITLAVMSDSIWLVEQVAVWFSPSTAMLKCWISPWARARPPTPHPETEEEGRA